MAATCVVYLRVSSDSQVTGHGFERQLETVKAYCQKHGFEIVGVYREGGVSGTTDETERPAFAEMVSSLLRNGCRTVIVEGLDRFARAYGVQESLLVYLASKDIALISARTEEDVTAAIQADPMKKALIQIQGVFSELEKSLLVKKLRKARQAVKARDGRCEGAKPYGQTPEEQAVIRRIRAMVRPRRGGKAGLSLRAVADRLNSEGIPAKRGGQWRASSVRAVLQPKSR